MNRRETGLICLRAMRGWLHSMENYLANKQAESPIEYDMANYLKNQINEEGIDDAQKLIKLKREVRQILNDWHEYKAKYFIGGQ